MSDDLNSFSFRIPPAGQRMRHHPPHSYRPNLRQSFRCASAGTAQRPGLLGDAVAKCRSRRSRGSCWPPGTAGQDFSGHRKTDGTKRAVCLYAIWWTCSSTRRAIAVSTMPGSTTATRTLNVFISPASPSVSASSAHFGAPYAMSGGRRCDRTELTLMMHPLRRSRICGSNA